MTPSSKSHNHTAWPSTPFKPSTQASTSIIYTSAKPLTSRLSITLSLRSCLRQGHRQQRIWLRSRRRTMFRPWAIRPPDRLCLLRRYRRQQEPSFRSLPRTFRSPAILSPGRSCLRQRQRPRLQRLWSLLLDREQVLLRHLLLRHPPTLNPTTTALTIWSMRYIWPSWESRLNAPMRR